jgi:hypothetical protein
MPPTLSFQSNLQMLVFRSVTIIFWLYGKALAAAAGARSVGVHKLKPFAV